MIEIDMKILAEERSKNMIIVQKGRQHPKILSRLVSPRDRAVDAFNKKSFWGKIKFIICLWKNEL